MTLRDLALSESEKALLIAKGVIHYPRQQTEAEREAMIRRFKQNQARINFANKAKGRRMF